MSAPILVKLEPGTYTVASTLNTKSYLDVEGSGRDITTITAPAGGAVVASNSFLRELTVSASGNTAGIVDGVTLTAPASGIEDAAVQTSNSNFTGSSFAIEFLGSGSVSVERTVASASTDHLGAAAAIHSNGSAPTVNVRDSEGTATSTAGTPFGAWFEGTGTVDLRDSTFRAAGNPPGNGLEVDNGTVTVENSALVGLGSTGSGALATGGTTHIAGSLVSPVTQNGGGSLTCIYSYKADYTAAPASC